MDLLKKLKNNDQTVKGTRLQGLKSIKSRAKLKKIESLLTNRG
jgi:hypothetical protein